MNVTDLAFFINESHLGSAVDGDRRYVRGMITQADKAERFLALHRADEPLLLPNPWDLGSARLLASLGFKALATTSSGFAATLGGVPAVAELAEAGVSRISVGGSFAFAALEALVSAATELREQGTYGFRAASAAGAAAARRAFS